MAKIGLTIFSIKVFNKNMPEKVCYLNNINGKALTVCLYEYLEQLSKEYDDRDDESIYKITNIESSEYFYNDRHYCSVVNSIIKSGKYGVESQIVDSISKKVKYIKTRTDADVLPFGFNLMIPAELTDTGVLIIQTHGSYGVTKLIKDLFSNFIITLDPCLCISIVNIMPYEYFRKLLKHNSIKSIRLIKYMEDTSDRSDYINGGKVNTIGCSEIETVYKRPSLGKELMNRIYDSFLKRYKPNEIVGIKGQEYDNIKIDFQVNSSVKTVNYNNFSNLLVSEDITKDVDINKASGHPKIDSLYKEMSKTSILYGVMLKSLKSVDENELYKKIFAHLEETDDMEVEFLSGNH